GGPTRGGRRRRAASRTSPRSGPTRTGRRLAGSEIERTVRVAGQMPYAGKLAHVGRNHTRHAPPPPRPAARATGSAGPNCNIEIRSAVVVAIAAIATRPSVRSGRGGG